VKCQSGWRRGKEGGRKGYLLKEKKASEETSTPLPKFVGL